MNQRGQMTIFIALIFQVLFVFFAMIVNVGLIVHDKINLQNSVDLAAYYGAQRQAEELNAIAHQNYVIRQAWKLLAWRIRELGDLGNKNHPLQSPLPTSNVQDVSIFSAESRIPSVCINNGFWGHNQNVCGNSNVTIPGILAIPVIAGFLPWNEILSQRTVELQSSANRDCNATGPMNQQMAFKWLLGYRAQMARAKETIRTYATNLSNTQDNFKDISGGYAKIGSYQTLTNNLTRANRASIDPNTGFKFYNSLGGGDYKKWLHEIPIYPVIYYTQLDGHGSTGCSGRPVALTADTRDTPEIAAAAREPSDVNDLYHSVAGVEKNPWMMAYVGVYAETKPHKPYLPFGEEITLKARAYAKPFGGRIGPWYYGKWQANSTQSSGDTGDRIDPLSPYQIDDSGSTSLSSQQIEQSIPNYSRFPGDPYGLKSAAALTLFKTKLEAIAKVSGLTPLSYSGTPAGDDGLASVLPEVKAQVPVTTLALGYSGPWIRDFEAAAVAPDLFDITYYSIDPDAYYNYIQPGLAQGVLAQKIPYDIGSNGGQNITGVFDQITIANNLMDQNSTLNFYVVKDPANLLTGWAPSGPYQYNFPANYGKCPKMPRTSTTQIPVPGDCPQGGRVGYSVKIVSPAYLQSSDLPLGGAGIKGSIMNPPPF